MLDVVLIHEAMAEAIRPQLFDFDAPIRRPSHAEINGLLRWFVGRVLFVSRVRSCVSFNPRGTELRCEIKRVLELQGEISACLPDRSPLQRILPDEICSIVAFD